MESILRKELKQWQRQFRAKHGREPTRRDMIKHPEISSTYETWTAINAETSNSSTGSKERKKESFHRRESHQQPSPKRLKSDDGPSQQVPARDVSNIFRTPTKPKRSSDPHLSSPSRNPFRTPTKSGGPSTPSSASRAPLPAPSPTGSIVDVQMTPTKPSPGRDSHYDYAASPSRLRTLVALHSTTKSPNKKQSQDGPSSQARENLLAAYTPRTKARKRLRGEEVPPTPRTDSGRMSRRASGAVFSSFGQVEKEEGKMRGPPSSENRSAPRGLAAYGFGSIGKTPETFEKKRNIFGQGSKTKALGFTLGFEGSTLADEDDDDVLISSPSKANRRGPPPASVQKPHLPARSSSSGSRSFKPLFASPSKHSPHKLACDSTVMTRTTSSSSSGCNGGGLFAAEIQARRRNGIERPRCSEEQRPLSPLTKSSSLVTDTTASGSGGGATSKDGESNRPKRTKQPSWKISTIVVSDGEGETDAGSSAASCATDAKTITVLPYQRYGSLRSKASSTSQARLDDEEDDGEGDDLFGYALSHTPTKVNERAVRVAEDADMSDAEGDSLLLSTLSLHSPSKGPRSTLPGQARQAIRAQRSHDARFLQGLLGAGRDELEVLQMDKEMPQSTAAKNWGEAKKREKIPDPKKRAKAPVVEPEQQEVFVAEPPSPISTCFFRAGRSGLADDEETMLRKHFEEDAEGDERCREESDDDWASEVESEEYGLGDGRMDAVDVM